jgi:N-acetylneuraminate synthase
VASVALGATVIEKHFTLRRADGGVDATFSLEPQEMQDLVEETKRAWQAMGQVKYGPTEAEKKSMIFRRSLYIAEDMQAGDILTRDNVRSIRPGHSLPPKYLDVVLDKKVNKNAPKGTPVGWNLIG